MRYISLHFTWQILEHERSRWAKELRRREGAPNCRGPLVFELTLTNERYATAHTNMKLSQILRKFQFSGHFRTVHFFIHPVVYKIKYICVLLVDVRSVKNVACLKSLTFVYLNIGPLALNFRGNDITQHGISQGSPQALKSFTTCFWMSAPAAYVSDHYATLLSYTAKGTSWGNDFTLMLKPDLILLFKGRSYRYDVVSLI